MYHSTSLRLRDAETRNEQLEAEYGRLRALVEPQTTTMENMAAELKAALEREQIAREEASHYRERCGRLDNLLAATTASSVRSSPPYSARQGPSPGYSSATGGGRGGRGRP